jgi:hypothetical protein
MVIKTGKVTVPVSSPGVLPSVVITDAAITTGGKCVLTPAVLKSGTDTRGQMEFYVTIASGSATISGELPELHEATDIYYVLDTDGTGGASLGALNYKGVWDASTTAYPTSPAKGDYYIVSVAGTISGVKYTIGDMMAYNGSVWNKIEGGNETDPVVGAVNGIVKANGSGTISAATAGVDYVATESDPVFNAWKIATPPLYSETDPVVGAVTGIVKANGAGTISAASAGTDYLAPNATADGTYPVYNDGVTSGQLASITIANGLITAVTVVP